MYTWTRRCLNGLLRRMARNRLALLKSYFQGFLRGLGPLKKGVWGVPPKFICGRVGGMITSAFKEIQQSQVIAKIKRHISKGVRGYPRPESLKACPDPSRIGRIKFNAHQGGWLEAD